MHGTTMIFFVSSLQVRLCQLLVAVMIGGRPCHFPAAECVQFLADGVWSLPLVLLDFSFLGGKGTSTERESGGRRGMVAYASVNSRCVSPANSGRTLLDRLQSGV